MLAEEVQFVIGVDTHADQHALAVVAAGTGARLAEAQIATSPAGIRSALALAEAHAPGPRAWAVEATAAYGRGLVRVLTRAGERVIELDRPQRTGERSRPKSDALDAVRAARTALSRAHPAVPRAHEGTREALRVLMVARQGAVETRTNDLRRLRALLISAPEALRRSLSGLTEARLLGACARLRPTGAPERAATAQALRSLAVRIRAATAEARALEHRMAALIRAWVPWLMDEPGVGPITAAQILISYSHSGRCRSEAAFARLAGAAPIPASSGKVVRHRLDRGGDRQLNRALHTIVICRRTCCPQTRAYLARRQEQGKSTREATRCLKRYLARSLFRRLEAHFGA